MTTSAAITYQSDLADIKRLIDRYGASGLMNIAATIHLRMRPYCPAWVKEPASDDEIISLMRLVEGPSERSERHDERE